MARSARQSKILDIINKYDIETQEDLSAALKAQNFIVTQATISRDIKELRLVKVMSENNKYKYAVEKAADITVNSKMLNMFRESVISIDLANNLVMVKTLSGAANSAGSVIDKMNINGVLGCIAGDDAVLIVTKDVDCAKAAIDRLNKFIN